jgi:hypothetical protein
MREANNDEVSKLREENEQLKHLVAESAGWLRCSANRYRPPKQFWNSIPFWEKQHVVETDLEYPEI